MMGMRKWVGFLMAMVLAVFALPAAADGGDYYRINMPTSAATGVQFNVTITNKAGFDTLKSFTITAPSGVYVTAVASGSANISGSKITAPNPATAGGTISVGSIAIGNNQSGTLKITATFPASCTAQTLAWTSTAKGGWIVSNEVFTLDAANSNLKTTVAGGNCTFSLTGDSTIPVGSTSAQVNMTLTNNAPPSGPAITAITLQAPSNVTIVSPVGGVITGLNVAGGASAPINVTVSTLPSCTGAAAASWSVASVTPSTLTQAGSNPQTTITAPVPACSLAISAPPSAAVKTDFPVTVALISGPGGPAGANVTLTSTCGYTGAATTPANGYSATFTGQVASEGTCTFNATADKGYPAAAALTGFKIYAAGNLACGDPSSPTPANTINGSASSGLTINDPGFAEGVRGQNIVKPGAPTCVPVNWTFTNNVLGAAVTVDAKGNTVPPNGVSFVWDQAAQPNAAYSYTVTWQPEWFGLASTSNRKTSFCTNTACTTTTPAQACLSPALLPSSIPGTDPACVSAEVWAVVSSGCTGTPAADQNACVIFTTTITDIKDPPIIRN